MKYFLMLLVFFSMSIQAEVYNIGDNEKAGSSVYGGSNSVLEIGKHTSRKKDSCNNTTSNKDIEDCYKTDKTNDDLKRFPRNADPVTPPNSFYENQ